MINSHHSYLVADQWQFSCQPKWDHLILWTIMSAPILGQRSGRGLSLRHPRLSLCLWRPPLLMGTRISSAKIMVPKFTQKIISYHLELCTSFGDRPIPQALPVSAYSRTLNLDMKKPDIRCIATSMLVTGFLASTVLCYSQNPDPRSGNIYATDAGSWVGLRAGFQSNGGALDERWSIAGSYELRSPSAASILIDYHLWHERYRNTANPTDTERLEMFGIVDLDFKIRYNVSRISFSMRGGVGTGTGLA